MKRVITVSLLLTAAVFLGLSDVASAGEIHLVRDGISIEKNIKQTDMDAEANPFWKGWTQRKGQTVDGRFVLDRRDKNLRDFPAPKSALGDCEFKVVFSVNPGQYENRGGGRGPWIRLTDRGSFGFLDKGRSLSTSHYPGSLPLERFDGPSPINLGDGKLHSMSARREGDVLSFLVDGKVVTKQKIDPKANLIFNLGMLESYPKIASIRFSADKFSDKLITNFKSAAPVETLFDGTGKPQETITRQSAEKFIAARIKGRDYVRGKAAVYRIPALAVTNKGTLLAFAEARASKFDWGTSAS